MPLLCPLTDEKKRAETRSYAQRDTAVRHAADVARRHFLRQRHVRDADAITHEEKAADAGKYFARLLSPFVDKDKVHAAAAMICGATRC